MYIINKKRTNSNTKHWIFFILLILSNPIFAAVGDACSTAESITPGTTCVLTTNKTISGTIAPSNPPCNTNNGKFYWLKFNTGGKTSYVFKAQSSTLDLTMEFYEGSCGALNRLACTNLKGIGALEEYTATGLKKYTDYYILVYHSLVSNPTTSNFNFCITDPSPNNDDCSGAVQVTPSVNCTPVNGNILGATASTVTGLTSTYLDIWYKFTAVTDIHYITVTGQGDFKPVVQLLSATSPCSGFTSLGTTTAPSTPAVKYTFSNLTVGKEYYYRVYHTSTGTMPTSTSFTTCIENGILNDNCSGAYTLIPGDPGVAALPTQGIVSGASLSTPPTGASCGTASHANEDVWYSFTATNQKHYFKLSGTDGGFKPCIELLSGTCPTFTSLGCKTSSTGGATIMLDYSNLIVGQTYFLRIYNHGTDVTTTPNFEVSVNTPPTNDECLNAKEVTVGPTCTSEFGDGSFASQSPLKPTCTALNTNNDDVWFKFKADSIMHFITVNATDGYNPVVEVFKEDCNTSILCDDASFPVSSIGSKVVTGLEKGKYYYYRIFDVAATNPASMAFTTCVVNVVENDNCEKAKKVNVGLTCNAVGGDGTYATQSLVGCSKIANDDVWYKFTATQTNHFISVTPSLKYDPVVQVFKDCATPMPAPNVFCKDTEYPVGSPGYSKVTGLTVGSTYYYRVYDAATSNPSTMSFTTCVTASPENDDCANAKTVYPGATCSEVTGNGSYATESLASCLNSANANDDVWYKFTAQDSRQYISVTPDDSKFDPIVQIFSACGTPLNTTSCNDDSYLAGKFGTALVTGLTKNSNYYYRVFDKSSTNQDTMTFKTCVVTPVINDDCSGALEVTVGQTCNPIIGDGTYATQSLAGCSGDAKDDVWFKFKATKSTQFISVTPDDSKYQPVVQVFSACATPYTPAICSDLNIGKFGTTAVSGLQIGSTYYYRVYDKNTTQQDTMTFKTCVVEPVKNDECGSSAIPITVGQTCSAIDYEGTYATKSIIGDCGNTTRPNDDVWFSFVASNSKQYINVTGQGIYDPIVQVFSACGTPLTGSICDDGNYPKGKFGSSAISGLTPGQTYYYRVYDAASANNTEMKFSTCVVSPAINDDCANAKTITVGTVCSEQTGDGTYATQSLNATTGNANDDVWYKFRPTSSTHVLYVNSSKDYDPVVQLYKACPATTANEFKYDGATSNSYNDVRFPVDGTGFITLTGLSTNQDYYYRVYDTKSVFPPPSPLSFTTCVTTIPSPPENDNPCTAKLIFPSVNCSFKSYTNQSATNSPYIQPPGCGDYKGSDVWFKVVVPFSGQLTFDTDIEGMSDADMALYSGNCNDLTLISCDDNTSTGEMPKISATGLIAGDTIYVRIWEKGNDNNGTFGLCVTKPPEATLVNGCSNLDFEGGLSSWFGTTGAIIAGKADADSPNYGPALFNTMIPQTRFEIETGGIDSYGGFPKVFEGSSSVRLGEPTAGNKGQSIEQYFTVTKQNSNFVYNYAAVLQSGNHPTNEQPFFKVDLFDDDGTPINCGEYLVAAPKTGVGDAVGFLKSPAASDVIYKPWTKVSIDLSNYIGKNVHVRFSTGSCSHTQHFGYVYLDCSCAPFQIITTDKVCKGDTARFYAPKGAKSYSWKNDSGTIVYTNDTDSLVVKTTNTGKFKVYCDVEMFGTAVCKSTLDTIYEVTNGPTLKITNPDTACAPGYVDLFNPTIVAGSTANMTYSYLENDQTTLIPDAAKVSKSGTYYIKGEQSATCKAIEPVIVVIQPKPVITGLMSICKGDSTILTSNISSKSASPWLSKNISIATISTSGKLKGIETGTDSITYTDKFGCQRDTIIKITPPLKPIISCGITTTNSIEFKWNDVTNATNYDISYIKSGVTSSTTNQTTLSFTKDGLSAGDKIQLKVTPKGSGCYEMDTLTCKATNCLQPTIIKQPTDTTVCIGKDATFKITAGGTSNGKFQWQKEISGTWTNLSEDVSSIGTTTPLLTIKNTTLSLQNSKIRCIVYEANNTCPINSNIVLLRLKEIPTVVVIDTTICEKDEATIVAKVIPAGNYNYSWTVPTGVANPGNVASFKTSIQGEYNVQVSELNANKLLLCNTDFDDKQVTSSGNYIITNQTNVSCWKTTASDGNIEVWNDGFGGVPAFSGKQFIELNATEISTIYQEFTALPNENVIISFAHRGRSGLDEMMVELGPVGGPYKSLGNFKDDNIKWGYYSIPYTFDGQINNKYVLRFTSVSAAGGNKGIGNFLDAISISTKPACEIQPAKGKVTVNPKPIISNKTESFCSGNIYNLSPISNGSDIVPSGTTYKWSVTDNINVDGDVSQDTAKNSISSVNKLINNTNVKQDVTYNITPLSGNCPGEVFTAIVSVNPNPKIPDYLDTICSETEFDATPIHNGNTTIIPLNTSYTWLTPLITGGITGGSAKTNESVIKQTLTNTTINNQTATYLITANSNSSPNCSTTFNAKITVEPKIQPVITCGASDASSLEFKWDNIPNATLYKYEYKIGSNGTLSTSQSIPAGSINQTISNLNSGSNVYFTLTPIGLNCALPTTKLCSNCAQPSISNNNLATSTDFEICVGEKITLKSSVVPTNTSQWSISTASIASILVQGSKNLVDITGLTSGKSDVSFTNNEGCETSISLKVNAKPIIADIYKTICSGETFDTIPNNTVNTIPTGTTYTWIVTQPLGITGATSSITEQSIFSQKLINNTKTAINVEYLITATNGSVPNDCSNTFKVIITVKPKPIIEDMNLSNCSGNDFTLNPVDGTAGNVIPNGTTYTWTQTPIIGITGNNDQSTAKNNVTVSLTNTTSSDLTITYNIIANAASCMDTFNGNFTVISTPKIADKTNVICSEQEFTITPTNKGNEIVPNGTTYTWSVLPVSGLNGNSSQNTPQNNISQTITNTTSTQLKANYSVTASIGNNPTCSSTFNAIISVNPKPFINQQIQNICSENTFNISPSDGGGNIVPQNSKYTWISPVVTNITGNSDETTEQSTISQTLTNKSSESIDVNYTVTSLITIDNVTCENTFPVIITVYPKPQISVDPIDICTGNSFSFSPVDGGKNIVPNLTTYTWTVEQEPNVTGGSDQTSSQTKISQTLNTTDVVTRKASYTILASTSSNPTCTNSFIGVVNINPRPSISLQNLVICSGDKFTCNPSSKNGDVVPSGTKYTWIVPNVTGITGNTDEDNPQTEISQSLINNTNAPIIVSYSVTGSVGVAPDICSSTFNLNVTVNPAPKIADKSIIICSGEQSNIQPINNEPTEIIPSNTLYKWTITNTNGTTGASSETNGTNSISQTIINTQSTQVILNYDITAFSGVSPTICSSKFTSLITVNPLPKFTPTATSQCEKDPLYLQANFPTATKVVWSSSNGYSNTSSADSKLEAVSSATATDNGTYSVEVTDQNGCIKTETVLVSINPPPPVSAGPDKIICIGEQTKLEGSGAISYSWDNGISDNTNFSPTVYKTYTVIGTDAKGCKNSDQTTVTVNPLPEFSLSVNDPCEKTDLNFYVNLSNATANTGVLSSTWNGPNNFTSQSLNASIQNVTLNASGLYSLEIIDNNKCKLSKNITATVNPIDVILFADIKPKCVNDDPFLLPVPNIPGGTWSASDNSSIQNPNSGVFDPNKSKPDLDYKVIVTYTTENSVPTRKCPSSLSKTILVNPIPDSNFYALNPVMCIEDTLHLVITNYNTNTLYTWDLGNGSLINQNSENLDFIYTKDGDFTVKLHAELGNCKVSKTIQEYIHVIPKPTYVDFTQSDAEIDFYNPEILFKSFTDGKYLQWSFGDGTYSNYKNPSHKFPEKPGEYIIDLSASNMENNYCNIKVTKSIFMPEPVIYFIPNTFTPNGDEINNVFQPIFTYGYDPQNYSFYIYNRWGELIFESHDSKIGWDGTFADNLVQNDTYIWKLEFKEKLKENKHSKTGHVNVFR